MTIKRYLYAGAALLGAWVIASPATPPLYDGLGFPDDPYLYVEPVPGAPAAKAQGATQTFPRDAMLFGVATRETGPQASVVLHPDALQLAPEARSVTVTVTPTKPPAEAAGGVVVTNVYRLDVTADVGTVGLDAKGHEDIQLRAPAELAPGEVMIFNGGQGWRRLETLRFGNDNYVTFSVEPGDYALIMPSKHRSSDAKHSRPTAPVQASGSRGPVLLMIAGGGLAAVAVLLGVIRVQRRRRSV